MKNKKLFAILTLVCFMFTLMPVAAFATTELYVESAAHAGKDKVTTTLADGVDVKVIGGSGDYIFWAEDAKGNVAVLSEATTQAALEFDATGTYYVYAVDADDASGLSIANMTKNAAVALIKDRCEFVEEALEVVVKKGDVEYTLSTNAVLGTANGSHFTNLDSYTQETASTPAKVTIVADNGWTNKGEVAVYLNNGTDAVKGEEIKFTTNSSYVEVEVDNAVTNRNGKVVINITASRAGDYKVYATHADADRLVIDVKATKTTAATIETIAQPAGNVALDTEFNTMGLAGVMGYTGVAFEVTSADGTILKSTSDLTVNDDYKISIVEKPADSNLDAADLTLRYDADVNNAYVLFDASDVSSFDEEGKYVIKVTMKNGDSATATVNVVEFDEPVRMLLTYKSNNVAYGDTAEVKAVIYMDKNGTMLTGSHDAYGGYGQIKYAASGVAVKDIVEATTNPLDPATTGGTLTTYDTDENGDEYVGTTINVLAINETLELTANATLTVVEKAASLKYVSNAADVAVNNKLIVNTVNADGDVVAAGLTKADEAVTKATVYVLSAPANAAYSAVAEVTDIDEVTVTFTASAAGEYKLQTVVRDDLNTPNPKYYSSVDTIVVGAGEADFEDIVVVSMGADSMIVNNELVKLDVAPYIENNRTMMQYNVLGVFGFDIQWVQETRSVVAEGNGIKVVMNIDSKVAVVNGEEVTLDVAPTIVNGRTVVPVGFLTGTFGITPNFIYGETGLDSILFAK